MGAPDLGIAMGSPAHAGIDPTLVRSTTACKWLPRACGDRPLPPRLYKRGELAPPRMRG